MASVAEPVVDSIIDTALPCDEADSYVVKVVPLDSTGDWADRDSIADWSRLFDEDGEARISQHPGFVREELSAAHINESARRRPADE